MKPPPSLEADPLIAWLREALTTTPYGEVGVIFRMHQGRIVTADRIHKEKYKLPGLTDPPDEE